jgi:hypothetical protein
MIRSPGSQRSEHATHVDEEAECGPGYNQDFSLVLYIISKVY